MPEMRCDAYRELTQHTLGVVLALATDDGYVAVERAFELSYETLDADVARLFRLLSVVPGRTSTGTWPRIWQRWPWTTPSGWFHDLIANYARLIPFPYDPGAGQVSAAALADPPPWTRARSAVAYDDASRPIVQALKYRDRHEAASLMTRLMGRAGTQLLAEADFVVPVPLHPLRLWRRRFNQAALIAQRLCADRPLAFQPLILKRARSTRPQVGLDHQARRKNVRGAFVVDERNQLKVAGRRIVLVDDVMTTGATASACTVALQRAGAASVDILTFALVLEPRRLHI
jgi:ComF family protein